MLFGYPAYAISDNWLHLDLYDMLARIHADIRSGRTPPGWPAIIPEFRRDLLRTKRGLRDRLQVYKDAFASLTEAEREEVDRALVQQNQIQDLLSAARDCKKLDELPVGIREPTANLFEFAFDLLTVLGLRDRHYAAIYSAMNHKVCPFCGIEAFDAPGAAREDDDHYLSKGKYPFAGANLRNLVPMGHKCNARYKGTKDLLWDGARRRRAVDPYDNVGFRLCLSESDPFEGMTPQLPRWVVQFLPPTEEAETWDQVFSIRERLCRDVLDQSYTKWIGEFAHWCRKSDRASSTAEDIKARLIDYGNYLKFIGFSDRAFLKLAVCKMLEKQCEERNERIVNILLRAVGTIDS